MNGHCRYIVLNYHALADDVPVSGSEFTVRPAEFMRQLDLIKQLNLPMYVAGQHSAETHFETGIAISFDDGNETDISVALPALRKMGMKATFFPVVNDIGKPSKLNVAQIRQLVDEGFTIGSHGMTHRELTTLTSDDQFQELSQSLLKLEMHAGSKVKSFAFPYGTYNESLIHLAEGAGYACAMTTEVALNDASDNNFLIHRWNVKRSTTIGEFIQMISGKGEIPWSAKTKSVLKHFARRLIGTEQIEQLKHFINPASHG